jgi:penicillin-binding protein-related factor A (putative recombinase)
MVGTGKPLEKEFSRSLRHYQATHPDRAMWFKRYPDFYDFKITQTRYIPPRAPSDFIALVDGVFYALECKSTRSKRFSCEWLREHQRESLTDIKRCGGMGFIVLSHRSSKKNLTRCWVIDIEKFLSLEGKCIGDGMKSIPFDDIMNNGVELNRINIKIEGNKSRQTAWDLEPLFGVHLDDGYVEPRFPRRPR